MTVAELIEKLKRYPPETEVLDTVTGDEKHIDDVIYFPDTKQVYV